MPLYQKSVLNKYLKQLDAPKVDKAYKKYANHFLNITIQDNIRNSKEEEYQGIFLTDLFVNILDYTLKPSPNFNLVAEFKNQTNSRKADGAILIDNKAIGVIELKGTNTKDLESIRKQAFDYKANQKECVYVITSNYEKLRFYINDATEFEEFNLFDLSRDQFNLLYLCLNKDYITNNIPLKIKEDSLLVEEQITKKFYKDYSLFKRELYRDLVKRNTKRIKNNLSKVSSETNEADLDEETKADLFKLEKNVKLNLFKKSQKLIDRFLFVFFAEDRGLLPPNSTLQILNKWKADVEFGDDRPLYDMFKQYFKFLDTGRQGTTNRAEIYAYNGGLFKEDRILDDLEIDNELLYNHTKILASYNFESQVDVNILGHIFENSLNEIESVNAEIEGGDFDKQTSKRKKDGVFYTPKYITKYIVENTVGKLCEEKKNELGFKEEEYFKGRKNRQQATIIKLVEILDTYREWLLQLTICDPACGSGAFLNQALDFLIKEHNYIDELKAKILGGGLVFSDIENTILENNIYGVDLNEESVEIAKLSLWLRTAQPRRKLNNLNSNIKCGNSLIDSKAVAGDKAFNWQEQFPTVFAKGGFDVIIGNPPYVQSHALDEGTKNYIYKNYSTAEYQINTYAIFTEKIIKIIKLKGIYSIIIPNYWLSTKYDSKLRELVFLRNHCLELVNVFRVFGDATVDTLILTGTKAKFNDFPKKTQVLSVNKSLDTIEKRLIALDGRIWTFEEFIIFKDATSNIAISFDEKLRLKGEKLVGDFLTGFQGMKPYEMGKGYPIQTRIMMNNRIYNSNFKIDETYYPLIGASNVHRYNLKTENSFIKYGKNLAAPRKFEIFSNPRLLINRILSKETIDALYVEDVIINNTDVFNFIPKEGYLNYLKPILAILATKVCSTYFKTTNVNLNRQAFPKLNVNNILEFPLPAKIEDDTLNYLTERVDIITGLNIDFQTGNNKFTKYLQSQFMLDKLPRKLENWYELDFGHFIKELNKAIKETNKGCAKNNLQPIKELTKLDEMDWMDVFETKKAEAQALKQQIKTTDKEIDAMVYELYGLSEEEIAIVENS